MKVPKMSEETAWMIRHRRRIDRMCRQLARGKNPRPLHGYVPGRRS